MPRNKSYGTIPRDINRNERFFVVSDAARVLYSMLCSQADDYGCYFGDPTTIRNNCYQGGDTLDEQFITAKRVVSLLEELSANKLIVQYAGPDGRLYLWIVDHISGGKKRIRRFPTIQDSVRRAAVTENVAVGETLFMRGHKLPSTMDLGAADIGARTNGAEWEANGAKRKSNAGGRPSATDPEPVPEPVPETDPDPDPEPVRMKSPGNGDGTTANRVASDSESGSDFVGGEEEKAGTSDLSTSRRTFKDAIAKLAGGHNEQAANLFVESALSVLKPGNGNDKDRADLSVLFYRLAGKCPDVRALRDALVWCFEAAIEKRVGKAGYGAWRKSVAARFGNWSVKGVVL